MPNLQPSHPLSLSTGLYFSKNGAETKNIVGVNYFPSWFRLNHNKSMRELVSHNASKFDRITLLCFPGKIIILSFHPNSCSAHLGHVAWFCARVRRSTQPPGSQTLMLRLAVHHLWKQVNIECHPLFVGSIFSWQCKKAFGDYGAGTFELCNRTWHYGLSASRDQFQNPTKTSCWILNLSLFGFP